MFVLQEKTESLHKCKTELVATRQTAMLAQQTLEELQTTCQRLDEVRYEMGAEFSLEWGILHEEIFSLE